MKKSFIFFAISALFLMLLFPVSVKADTVATLSFVYDSAGDDYYCGGTASESGKGAVGGDFQWSGKITDAIEKSGDWIGVNNGVTACIRTTSRVTLPAAGDYTFTIDLKWTEHETRNLPQITITDHSAQNPDMGSSAYFNDNEIKSLVYTFTGLSAKTYDISVYFPAGERTKQFVKNLVIASSAPATPTYAVTVNNDGNGTASADKAKYEAGETVTLTAEPNANYLFNGWTTSDDGFSFADEHSASTTFAMPAKAVTVQANFVACSGQTVTVNVNDGEMGSATGGGSYCAGDQVDLTATPESGYRFVNWTVTSGSASLDNVNNASTHFTMSNPAAAVTVRANFEVDPCFASLTVQVEDAYLPNGAVSASKGYPTTMIFKEKQAEGSAYRTGCNGRGFMQVQEEGDRELFIPVNITTAGNYIVKARSGQDKNTYINIYAITGDGETITYNSTTYYKKTYKRINKDQGESFAYSDYTDVVSLPIGVCLIGLYSEWSWAAYDEITITCTDGTVFCQNTITMQKSGDASAENPTSSVGAAMPGATITVTAAAPSANHYFSGWTASPEVTFADETASTTTFVMPEEDVTITANYEALVSSALTFAADEGGSIVSATAGGNPISSGEVVFSGTSVTLTAGANSNYVFINWTDDNNSDAVVSTNAAFTFSMPATATAYTANFAQIDNVISQGSETGSDKGNSGGGASIAESHIADFDAFGHNVVKLTYSGMSGESAYCGWNIGKSGSYNSASSAGATGFGFYYKTEAADDAVAMWFDPNTGNHEDQRGMQLEATENVWKYVYIAHAVANGWNHDNIIIYINGDQDGKTTAHASGAIYIADIAATSITSKPDIDSYTYTRNSIPAYGTLCLPMAGTTVTGATLYSVAGSQEEGGKLYIVLEEQDNLKAGEPYIFEADGSTLTVTMSGPQSAVNNDANGLVGTYTEITAPAYNEAGDHNYVLAPGNDDNVVFKKVGSNVTVGAYRAYININNVSAFVPAPAMGRRYIRFGVEGQEQVVAIEMISDDASMHNSKVLQNGQLFIIRDGHIFNAQGAKIK